MQAPSGGQVDFWQEVRSFSTSSPPPSATSWELRWGFGGGVGRLTHAVSFWIGFAPPLDWRHSSDVGSAEG